MVLRSRPAGAGSKPPKVALAEDRCRERLGKVGRESPAGVLRKGEHQ